MNSVAENNTDPRLQGEDYNDSDITTLFNPTNSDEILNVPAKLKNIPLDDDHSACTIFIHKYPRYASLKSVADTFASFGSLRSNPHRLAPDSTDVKVIFRTKTEADFAYKWFVDKNCQIDGNAVDLEKES